MRRFTSVLLSILLGALAVGAGMGFFLHKANADRASLADIAMQAQSQAKEAQKIREQAVNEANKKLDAANTEIKKAQNAITALKEERDLIAKATPLREPTPREQRGWKQSIDLPLGVSIKYPANIEETTNEKNSLVLSKASSSSITIPSLSDPRWMSIQPYDESSEQAFMQIFTSADSNTSFSYIVNGHLLIGTQAVLPATQQFVFVAHTTENGEKTHLLWAKVPLQDQKSLQLALGTLDFKQ